MHRVDLSNAWLEELELFEPDSLDFETAGSADLPASLEVDQVLASADDHFWTTWGDWNNFVCDKRIWLPLEQSCYEGQLLSMDQRITRLASCPEELLRGLRWFFELCPSHVKHDLAHYYYFVVRIERARRTGRPDWRPDQHALRQQWPSALW